MDSKFGIPRLCPMNVPTKIIEGSINTHSYEALTIDKQSSFVIRSRFQPLKVHGPILGYNF